MTTETVAIHYGSDTVEMTWDGAHASAPICIDGDSTQYQTADARHRTEAAVRLCCRLCWGPVYDTEEGAEANGMDPGRCCIWDEVEYETVDAVASLDE